MAAVLSASSRRLKSLQFGAAYLAEGAQRLYRMAVHKFAQFGKRLVRCEIRLDNYSNNCLGFFDHVGRPPCIEVSESMFWLTSLELSRDQASDIAPFLDRRPRHARHRASIAHNRRRVADDEHAGHLLKSWSVRQTPGG
jgi:hypothetical protein